MLGHRVLGVVATAVLLAACGGSTHPRTAAKGGTTRQGSTGASTGKTGATGTTGTTGATAVKLAPKPPPPSHPQLLPVASDSGPVMFAPAVRWRGRTAAWISRLPSGVSVMTFDQHLLELHLHSGTIDAGTLGWRYGPSVGGFELTRLVAAFNGGFRLSVGAGGFESYGRVGAPLQTGLASIVTYADGTTEIGNWHEGVPAPGNHVVSVRQNLSLLIDHGVAANTGCVSCWGATLGGVIDPARSALGITADGRLVWVGGEHLTVSALASALLGARAVRAVELDINPE